MPRLKRHSVAPVRPLAGPNGSLFVDTDGLAVHQVLDGDEEFAYALQTEAVAAWRLARALSWGHPGRLAWRPPVAALRWDGFPVPSWRPPSLPPAMPAGMWEPSWDASKFRAQVAVDVKAVRTWRRTQRAATVGIEQWLDGYEAVLAEIARLLGGVHDQERAWAAWWEWAQPRGG